MLSIHDAWCNIKCWFFDVIEMWTSCRDEKISLPSFLYCSILCVLQQLDSDTTRRISKVNSGFKAYIVCHWFLFHLFICASPCHNITIVHCALIKHCKQLVLICPTMVLLGGCGLHWVMHTRQWHHCWSNFFIILVFSNNTFMLYIRHCVI